MNIKAVLFDLDGTLLPMDQDTFMEAYFRLLAGKLMPHGYEPKALVNAVWAGTGAMVKNTGEATNEEVFWSYFSNHFAGERDARADLPLFAEFYEQEFDGVKAACGYNPEAAKAIEQIQQMGLRMALATNPLFPQIATNKRIRWSGLNPDIFEFYTTYEDSHYCKPNPKYYEEVVARMNLRPEECLMVGNDVTEDMVAETLGMKVFLLTDCLINKENKDISAYPQGGFAQLLQFIASLGK